MGNPRFNASGCKDMTAYEAIKHVCEDEKRVNLLIKDLKCRINESGFELVGRIAIKDKKGRIFR